MPDPAAPPSPRTPWLDDARTLDSPRAVIAALREGLPVAAYGALKDALGLTTADLAAVVHIAPRTVTRRKQAGRLTPDESERVWRLLRLVQHAERVLGDRDAVRAWMREPNYALGDETPLRFADTEPGARRVEALLGQIEHGLAA